MPANSASPAGQLLESCRRLGCHQRRGARDEDLHASSRSFDNGDERRRLAVTSGCHADGGESVPDSERPAVRAAPGPTRGTDVYDELRPLLFSIAYRMVGSVSDAEDIVQEAYLRYHRATQDGTRIDSPKAYLSTIATRLAVDHLRLARVRREQYIGPWLPEPLLTDPAPDAAQHAETADSMSMAFLVLLESLSPVERAVFLLREVFDYPYHEIARIVDKTEENCRQLAVRARRRIAERRPRFDADRRQRDELMRRFLAACEEGDVDGLVRLLAEDVVFYGDGGGTGFGLPNPVHGRGRVSRLLQGFMRQVNQAGLTLVPVEVNGQPGAQCLTGDGRLVNVISIDVGDGLIQTVRSVINPAKLRHLAPLADLPALYGERPARD
ncbi:MAG: RNA polymerase sigma-70 factor [Propionibacteriales bacterium]|nr:RNA polymerase sigma-70 factor [Propionibacteriales bacterium]